MTNKLLSSLPPLPPRMQRLPVDARGYPVPWFVAWFHPNGTECAPGTAGATADFRVVGTNKIARGHTEGRCWICGETLGSYKAFTIGPMCAVNRVSSEPPSHLDCADYAARACPFLAMPKMRRREVGLPQAAREAAGHSIKRNPGCALVWVTRRYTIFSAGDGGRMILFDVGDPVEVRWYCEGRRATRAEVQHSIDTGLPLLRQACDEEPGGPAEVAEAHAQLDAYIARAQPYLPPEVPNATA